MDAAYKYIEKAVSLETAEEWMSGFREGVASLATLPERCLAASEDRFYQAKHPGPLLRVYLHWWGRSAWRVLFTIHEATADDPPSIVVRQVRSAAQKAMTRWPPE